MRKRTEVIMNLKVTDKIEKGAYISIPKCLLYEKEYKELSIGAKILYEFILDRWNLSKRNMLCNEKNEVYILFKQKKLCELMNVSSKTIKKYFDELVKYKLIYVQKQKLGFSNKIYLTDKINNFHKKKIQTMKGKNGGNQGEKLLYNNTKYNKNNIINDSIYNAFTETDWNSLYCNRQK